MDVLNKLETQSTMKAGVEVKTYDATKLQSLSRKQIEAIWSVLRPVAVGVEMGTFLGYTDGAEVFHVAFKDGTPIAFHIKGDGDGGPFDITQPEGTTAFSGGLRLNGKARRTKRNRRNTKGRKLRKLASRRR